MKKKKYSIKAVYCLIPAIAAAVICMLLLPEYIYFLTQLIAALLILLLFSVFSSGVFSRLLPGLLLGVFLLFEYTARELTGEDVFFSRKAAVISVFLIAGVFIKALADKKKTLTRSGYILSKACYYASLGALTGGIAGSSSLVLFNSELDQGIYIFYALSIFLPSVFGLLGGAYGLGSGVYEWRGGSSLPEKEV